MMWLNGNRIRVALITMGIVVVVAAMGWLSRKSPSDPVIPDFELASAGSIVDSGGVAAAVSAAPRGSPTVVVPPDAFGAPRVLRAREAYIQYAQYPPSSRAFDESYRELVDWNRPIVYDLRLSDPDVDPAVYASLKLDRMFAGPGEEMVARLRVRRAAGEGEKNRRRLVLDLEGFVEAEDKSKADESGVGPRERVERVRFSETDDPEVWEARFTPSKISELAKSPLNARLVVELALGDTDRTLATEFRYSANEAVSIYGMLGEEVVDGSLRVTLDAEVHRAGPIKVRGVLFDESGTRPLVTYSEYQHPEATGRQPLTMTFFGKAIVDAGSEGPYRIGSIHGILRDPSANPPEVFWAYRGELETARYASSDFSADEWTHPLKIEKLEMYERLLSQVAE